MPKRVNYFLAIGIASLLLSGCTWTLLPTEQLNGSEAVGSSQAAPEEKDAFYYNARLGRGVNLGNALDAPYEGAWGLYIRDTYIPAIAEAGFDNIRIPIRWSVHADRTAPYTINDRIFERVDTLLAQAQEHNLVAVINIHHYAEMMYQPLTDKERFLALWQQIAERYKDYPDTLYFEILNEPHDTLTDEIWNPIWQEAYALIRESNPTRAVIVGPTNWNNINKLDALELPDEHANLIVTFHYYSPFEFTHQGANWVANAEQWLGNTWTGTDAEVAAVRRDFDKATAWADANNVPLYMGEFGSFRMAPAESRSQWTAFVSAEAQARGFSFAYWEFGASGFGAFDQAAQAWRPELLTALIQE